MSHLKVDCLLLLLLSS